MKSDIPVSNAFPKSPDLENRPLPGARLGLVVSPLILLAVGADELGAYGAVGGGG